VAALADALLAAERAAANVLCGLRGVFNAVTLSPYTDFVPKALALVRELERRAAVDGADRVDFLAHLVRQLFRHLSAYDLVTFHHRGANYPDALLLDDLLADLLPLAAERPDLFAGDDRGPVLRRRAVRHGVLLRLQYAGHPVPDAPTSPGENLRVLPEPFARVPDEQILLPTARRRRLFADHWKPDHELIRRCFADLDRPDELRELGTALFVDRPLGFGKAPGEPDQTLLVSQVAFSRSLAETRLRLLSRRPDWLPDDGSVERWLERLRVPIAKGLPLENAGAPPRPGVVSLHDAGRVADDFVLLRTTRQAVSDFGRQYDLSALAAQCGLAVPPPDEWRLLAPGGTERQPTLCVYDRGLVMRLEMAAHLTDGYATRGGVEFPRAGLRVIRADREAAEGTVLRPTR
jgi:hypothetical protein